MVLWHYIEIEQEESFETNVPKNNLIFLVESSKHQANPIRFRNHATNFVYAIYWSVESSPRRQYLRN